MPVWLTTAFSILSPIISVLTFYLKVKNTREKDEAERKKARKEELCGHLWNSPNWTADRV